MTKIVIEMFQEKPEIYQGYGRMALPHPLFSAAVHKVNNNKKNNNNNNNNNNNTVLKNALYVNLNAFTQDF